MIQPPPWLDASSSPPARVVVGIDAAQSCAPAVGFACQAARQRGFSHVRPPAVTLRELAPDPAERG